MRTIPHLIFRLHGSLYAVKAEAVREILWLPELTPFEESPPYMTGVFNLRGKVIPAIDLNLRFGHTHIRYQTSDLILVLESDSIQIGIIVGEVLDVRDIPVSEIEGIPAYLQGVSPPHYVEGEVKTGDDIIMILNLNNLIKHAKQAKGTAVEKPETPLSERPPFCPDATPEERTIFQDRAHNLRQPAEDLEFSGLIPLAVVGLSDEYIAIGLDYIREFADVKDITPIPCCPKYIIGNMNLRGDILTIIDIREPLRMTIHAPGEGAKIIVSAVEDIVAGILADDVLDVIYLHPDNITSVPMAAKSINKEYFKGTARYGEKILSILDLQKILMDESLIVKDEV